MARATDWVDTLIGLNTGTGAQASVEVDGGSTAVVLRGVTIVRTIIAISIHSSTVAGAWGIQEVDRLLHSLQQNFPRVNA